jgi:hypothetical protein
MKILITLCVLLTGFYCNADDIVISGKVIDSDTEKPLSYAHILLENSHLGTVTNEDGFFVLFVPERNLDQQLVVTHVGYESLKVSFKEITDDYIFKLVAKDTELKEIVISSINPFDIVIEANKRKSENYLQTPSRLVGFYRHGIKIDSDYTQFLEASVEIVMPHYSLILNNSKVDREIYVNELRAYETINYFEVSPYRLFDDLFFIPINEKSYNAEVLEQYTNDEEIVIEATPKILTSGLPGFKLTIDRTSYSFKEVQYYIPIEFWEKRDFSERVVNTSDGKKTIKEKRTNFQVTYSFYNYQNKWHLKQVNQINSFSIITDNQIKSVIYYINYVTNNIEENSTDVVKKNYINKEQNLYKLKRKVDNTFWTKNSILIPSKEQLEVIKKIESLNSSK